jgi:hypothetical protein
MCAMQTAWLSERNLGSQFLSMARIQLPERGIHVVNIKVYEQISISIKSGNCYPAKRQQSSQGHFGRVRAQNRPRVSLSLSKHADHNFRPANTATEKQSQVTSSCQVRLKPAETRLRNSEYYRVLFAVRKSGRQASNGEQFPCGQRGQALEAMA